jgi:hypothetical protein
MRPSTSRHRPTAGVRVAASIALVLLLSPGLPAQSVDVIRPFVSDGCTTFPDGLPGRSELWQHCCVAHDLAYWKGGTRDERRRADRTLGSCVNAASRNPVIGSLMRFFVRVGGGPEREGGSRWGYGWTHVRGYAQLTAEEQARIEATGTPDLAVQRHSLSSHALPIPSETGDYCVDAAVSLLREVDPRAELLSTDGAHANGVVTMRTNVCRNPVQVHLAVDTHSCREPRFKTSPLPIKALQIQAAGEDCAPLVASARELIASRESHGSRATAAVLFQKK